MTLLASAGPNRPVSPCMEMGAYETLWIRKGATFKSLRELFASEPDSRPSDFIDSEDEAQERADHVARRFKEAGIKCFGVRLPCDGEYPARLRDEDNPAELLYFQGRWSLAETRTVSVIGSRKATREGLVRTKSAVKSLVSCGFTVVSGLAAGIDRMAHETAIKEGGRTIAVIGTPLSHCYPRENAELQREIAERFLLISQVPLMRYESQDYRKNRMFFPKRNETMSALTEATVIVEAGDGSGTLIQARAALKQGRKLFVLDNCFRNPDLTWPHEYERMGAVRVKDCEDLRGHLAR